MLNRLLLFAIVLTGTMGLSARSARAGGPTYLILRGHPGASYRHVKQPAYAYGWFGVQPRRFRARHHGYYNNYSQWMIR